jgi:hypothetical protein
LLEIRAVSLAPAARVWLESSPAARVLHVFPRACNLLNSSEEALSLVAAPLGNGPFSLVLEPVEFTAFLRADSPVSLASATLRVGELAIEWRAAAGWAPRPDWEAAARGLHAGGPQRRDSVRAALSGLLRAEAPSDSLAALRHQPRPQLPARLADRARRGIRDLSIPDRRAAAARALAGLGPGLTPAGDDYLVGWMHAAWACRPCEATALCRPLLEAAAPRTHALSRAWLESAARGEAGEPWHRFLGALIGGDEASWLAAARDILPTGHTSGADALAGFLAGLEAL